MSWGFWVRMMWRESRGARGRLIFFGSCIAIGVMAVVGVASLTDGMEAGIRSRSRELLGGDLAVESRRPLVDIGELLPPAFRSAPRVEVCVLPTMARTPMTAGGNTTAGNAASSGSTRLVEVKAIALSEGAHYPLAGELQLDPPSPLQQLLTDHTVVVAPDLMTGWGLQLGDSIQLGGESFRIAGCVVQEPDALNFSLAFGPRVFMTRAALDRVGLLGFGNRVRFRTLVSLAGLDLDALHALRDDLKREIPGGGVHVTVESHDEAQPRLRRTLQRVERYLGLVALLSLVMGSVGVAQIISAWLSQSARQTAVLRCLGLRPRDVMTLYLGHVLVLALVGSAVGGLAGALLPVWVSWIRPDVIPVPEHGFASVTWAPLVRGMGIGAAVSLVFSLLPLTRVWQVSPARVLRDEAEPLPVPVAVRVFSMLAIVVGVWGAAFLQSRDFQLSLGFTGGLGALGGLLWLGARGLHGCVARLPRERLPVTLWQGAAALARPGAGTTGSIVALGLGTLVVLGITLVERALQSEIATALPNNAPSLFAWDVQPDQWPEIEALSRSFGAGHVQGVPVVMARLAAVDGKTVEQLLERRDSTRPDPSDDEAAPGRRSWVLTREQRITWMQQLSPDNVLLEGELWEDPERQELSLEVEFAKDLGAVLGSVLRFDVQGVPIEFTVTSIRQVEWRSFSVNFFLVAEPGVLDAAPHFVLGAIQMPVAAEQQFQDQLTEKFPNVTVIRVRQVLEQVTAILGQVALGIRLLGGFAVVTGLIILIGGIASSQLRRQREAALLKTLGVTRARVAALFAWEYALTGAVAGTLGASGAYLLTWVFLQSVMELNTRPSIALTAAAVVVTLVLAVVGGLLASLRALWVRPLQVFRQQQ